MVGAVWPHTQIYGVVHPVTHSNNVNNVLGILKWDITQTAVWTYHEQVRFGIISEYIVYW